MQIAYLLYDRFTALDITGPARRPQLRPGQRIDLRRRAGGAAPKRVGHPLARRRRVARRGDEPGHRRRPRRLRQPAAARARAAPRVDPGRARDQHLDHLGLHRLAAARGRRPPRRRTGDHPLARARPARRARGQARARPGRRARQDRHGGGRLLRDRHGPPPRPEDQRRRGRPGGPARHRVRPRAAARRRLAGQGAAAEIVELVRAVFEAREAGTDEAS